MDDAPADHFRHLADSGELTGRRVRRTRDEIEAIALTELRDRWGSVDSDELDALAGAVVAGESDPYAAADQLLAGSGLRD